MANQTNPSYQQSLENLLSIASPLQLKESIITIYFNYLIHLDTQCLPKDFTMIAEDIYLLIKFLEEVNLVRSKKGD
jgi:hypothetical protein